MRIWYLVLGNRFLFFVVLRFWFVFVAEFFQFFVYVGPSHHREADGEGRNVPRQLWSVCEMSHEARREFLLTFF